MATYLLSWNPKKYPWGSVQEEIKANRTSDNTLRWSIGNTQKIAVGDRFFMIRVGEEPRGIVTCGTFLSGPQLAPHWDIDKRSRGHETLYANIKIEIPIGDPVILRDELDQPRFAGVKWSSQSSGIVIRPDVAEQLEREWRRRVPNHNDGGSSSSPIDRHHSGITAFFRDTLSVHVTNTQWSWGGYDPSGRLFLRVWKDQLEVVDGVDQVEVWWKTRKSESHGQPERKRHLRSLQEGAEGFGVMCTAIDPHTTGPRKIKTFDSETLFRLGDLVERGDKVFAIIIGRVSVDELMDDELIQDLRAIQADTVDQTTKAALVDARIGQRKFRTQVLARWGSRCCVTGATTADAIRASHIKPWRDSTNAERLDPENGLPMVATLDALFDSGLVSFGDDGSLLVSKDLTQTEQRLLGILGMALSKPMSPRTRVYLKYHREAVFERKRRVQKG